MMVPTFKPNLNQMSLKIVKEKGHHTNTSIMSNTGIRLRNNSNDDIERDLISQIERN